MPSTCRSLTLMAWVRAKKAKSETRSLARNMFGRVQETSLDGGRRRDGHSGGGVDLLS